MKIDLSKFDRGVYLVNALAIIFKDGKILIGKRKLPDPYIEKLTWSFPGGRLHYDKDIENSLKEEVKKRTNLDIKVKKLISARVSSERHEFLNLYYYCEPISNTNNTRAGDKFTEVKWVRPTEVTKYFTTSTDPFILDFLAELEKKSI